MNKKEFSRKIWNILSTGSTLLAYDALRARQKQQQSKITQEQLNCMSQKQDDLLQSNEVIRKSLEVYADQNSTQEQRISALEKIVTEVNNISNNTDTFLNIDFSRVIEAYKEFLSLLTIEQLCMLINITTSLFMLGCCTSIFFAVSGNYIIRKLDLENKYPKFSSYIKLRILFQEYYILINLLGIVLSLLFIIYINYTGIMS